MQRIIVVYNRRSSQHDMVRREVLEPLRGLAGVIVGKYEVERTDVDDNARKLAMILRDGDIVIAAGGDATGAIAVNGIMCSQRQATLAAFAYGNFNDLARTLGTARLSDVINIDAGRAGNENTKNALRGRIMNTVDAKNIFSKNAKIEKMYPLEVVVDGMKFRDCACYATIGMMAEAVEIFDEQKVRKSLTTNWGRMVGAYLHLAGWYFRNRSRREFLPEGFTLNGVKQQKGVSDYLAVNGRSMARVMKGGEDFTQPKRFRSAAVRTVKMWPLASMMMKSMTKGVPGEDTYGDEIVFPSPSDIEIQAEGEYKKFKQVKKIEIRKNERFIRVVTK